MEDRNPRGLLRPKDGRGRGVGMPRGRRAGRNAQPCQPIRNMGRHRGRNRGPWWLI